MSWIFRTHLLIGAVAFPLALYVVLRVAASAGLLCPGVKRKARWVATVVLLWISALPIWVLLLRLQGNQAYVPHSGAFPTWMNGVFVYPFWIWLIIVLELLGPFLFFDLVALLGRLTRRAPGSEGSSRTPGLCWQPSRLCTCRCALHWTRPTYGKQRNSSHWRTCLPDWTVCA